MKKQGQTVHKLKIATFRDIYVYMYSVHCTVYIYIYIHIKTDIYIERERNNQILCVWDGEILGEVVEFRLMPCSLQDYIVKSFRLPYLQSGS